jgi:hypothetical protein
MSETQAKPTTRLLKVSPEFIVPDVVASSEYYRDTLGFEILSYFLDPPVYAMVERDSVVIHFAKADAGISPAPNSIRRRGLGLDAYIWVNDLDTLCAELKERGAKIVDGPVMRVYQCYEMTVEDNCGFRLVFSMDTSAAKS